MDRVTTFPEQWLFHLSGQRQGQGLAAIDAATLRPALLAPYRELDRLRHDFPVVLPDETHHDQGDAGAAQSLSSLVDAVVQSLAPRGIEGERLRRHLLRLERELRIAASRGAEGRLSVLWAEAAARLGAQGDEAVGPVLAQAAAALNTDGLLIGCDGRLPSRLLAQAWRQAQARKAREFTSLIDRLMRGLSDICRAAWAHSQAGRAPQALRAAVGGPHGAVFDFDAMSRLVARRAPPDELPPSRRRRIEWALAALARQAFYRTAVDDGDDARDAFAGFAFDNCLAAMQAFRSRLPAAAELVKAIAIAELEVAGHYVEAEHDALFERHDEHALGADDMALLPDYLVSMDPERNDAPENAALLDMLSSGMPVKVLVQVSDLLEEATIGSGHFAFGVRSARLATTAMGLGGMFVLQCASAALVAERERVARGMGCRGPALFCVFAGSPEPAAGLPPYLGAAAAIESRAFPTFCYDAAAGADWAARFSLRGNRMAEADWPTEPFEYADETMQRQIESVAFTYADFALCDRRHAAHFAAVPSERWHAAMLPAADWLALADADAAQRVPFIWAVDADDRLYRVVVDASMMQATRRCMQLWHRLQEHGGVNEARAERLRALERAAAQPASPATSEAPAAAPAVAEAAPPDAPAEDRTPGEAWIETARCPTCNECQLINDRMFAYNANQQAYIKDIKAGSFRQLVEAAESCQVAIIHPGQPRDPNEAGLDELIARAQPFQ